MKLSSIPAILTAAAGLVSAAPIRIVIAFPNQRPYPPQALPLWEQSVRWGHAAAPAFNNVPWSEMSPTPTRVPDYWPILPTAAQMYTPAPLGTMLGYIAEDYPPREDSVYMDRFSRPSAPRPGMRKGGCGGMRAKSVELGNRLRVILGLPPIEPGLRHGAMGGVIVETIPRPIVVTHHRHHMRPHYSHVPFTMRLSHALASLGPWEGRAVSFVLGCGLGVLLRMLFVFGVLIVRSVRACRAQRRIALEEDSVVFVAGIKEPVIVEALPEYAEKTEAAAEVPQTNSAN